MAAYVDPLDTSISKRKIIFMMVWPSVVEQILMTLVNYIDTAMVGSLGVNATAAVSVNTALVWVANGILFGISGGISVLVGRTIGEKKLDKTRNVIKQGIIYIFAVGIAMTLVAELLVAPFYARVMGVEPDIISDARSYLMIISMGLTFQLMLIVSSGILRSMGNTKTPMKYNIIMNFINVGLNFLLIYPVRSLTIFGMSMTMPGAGLGVKGAALATFIANTIAGILMFTALFSRKNPVWITAKEKITFDRQIAGEVSKLGVPIIFERLSLNFGQIVLTFIVTGLGTYALASHNLANTAESICWLPAGGFGIAVTTLVAQSVGAQQEKLANEYTRLCLLYNILVMIFMATMMFIFAPKLIGFFIKDKAVIKMGATLLRIEAIAEPCIGINQVLTGVMKARGDTRWPFYVALSGMWFVRIPVGIIVVKCFGLGLRVLWIVMAVDWIIRAAICFVRLKVYMKKDCAEAA